MMSAPPPAFATQPPPSPQAPQIGSTALLVAILALGMLQSATDLFALFRTGYIDLLSYSGPAWLKAAKDALVLAGLVLPSLIGIFAFRARVLTRDSSLVLSIVAVAAGLSLVQNGPIIAAAGLRWFLPIALLFLLPAYPPAVRPVTASRLLFAAMSLNFAAQCIEVFTMPPVYGQTWFGLSARTPGFFLVPNTAAFFASVCTAAMLAFEPKPGQRTAALLVGTASCVLTQSGTGLVAIATLWLVIFGGGRRAGIALLGLIALPLLFIGLEGITGREDYLRLSGGERIRVFVDIVLPVALRVDGFGVFTNTASLILDRANTAPDGTVVAIDSFIGAFVGNFGAFAIPIAILTVRFAVRSKSLDWRRMSPLLIVYGLFACTTIVTEAFPMSVLLPLLAWASAWEAARYGHRLTERKRT